MKELKQRCGRVLAMMMKEFLEIRRDRLAIIMLFAVPVINLCVLGLSVNTDPRHVRSALIDYDRSSLSRTLIAGMTHTGYFDLLPLAAEKEADRLFRQGKVPIVVIIPAGFAQDLLGQKRPQLLVQTDATDPLATANAVQALAALLDTVFERDIKSLPPNASSSRQPLAGLIVHKRFNPENVARFNLVPGLAGVILSIVTILMSSLSILRERETGSLVHIRSSPISPGEFILGKTLPYFLLGALLALLLLLIAHYSMAVPLEGCWLSLLALFGVFLILSLATGVIFSTLARSQLQAMQLASFYFLLSTMLSGFMTPYIGMPAWSQMLGSLLPLTYFLRLSRGIALKGYGLVDMTPDAIALLVLSLVVSALAYLLFRRSLRA